MSDARKMSVDARRQASWRFESDADATQVKRDATARVGTRSLPQMPRERISLPASWPSSGQRHQEIDAAEMTIYQACGGTQQSAGQKARASKQLMTMSKLRRPHGQDADALMASPPPTMGMNRDIPSKHASRAQWPARHAASPFALGIGRWAAPPQEAADRALHQRLATPAGNRC